MPRANPTKAVIISHKILILSKKHYISIKFHIMRYSSLRITEKLYFKIQLLITPMEQEFVLLILVLHIVYLLPFPV